MSDFLRNKSCTDFTAVLSSSAPVPGGGGAAALVGALSAALCSMAGNLTVGKKKYASVEGDIKLLIAGCGNIGCRLLELIDEDAEGFAPLSKAYSLPKDTEGYADIMRSATLNACSAPMKILRCCCDAVELIDVMSHKCSRLMLSDVACAATLARSAIEAAAVNVYVNTRLLKGDADAALLEDEVKHSLGKYIPLAQAVYDTVITELTEVKTVG